VNEPRYRLQLLLGNVLLQNFEEDAEVWLWRLYAGKQVGDDSFEERYVLQPNTPTSPYVCRSSIYYKPNWKTELKNLAAFSGKKYTYFTV